MACIEIRYTAEKGRINGYRRDLSNDCSIIKVNRESGAGITSMRWNQYKRNQYQECKQHINDRKHTFWEIIKQDVMQPSLNEAIASFQLA